MVDTCYSTFTFLDWDTLIIAGDYLLQQVYDRCALSQVVKDEMYKCYPDARRAHLKSGGNFPYLSRADEVIVYLQVNTFSCHKINVL